MALLHPDIRELLVGLTVALLQVLYQWVRTHYRLQAALHENKQLHARSRRPGDHTKAGNGPTAGPDIIDPDPPPP